MTAISILLLEDSAIDADLVRACLKREGLEFAMDRVEAREDYLDALATRRHDLILADYSLPSFNGMAALEIAREARPECPFIFVSATLGEELAVDCLRKGATDYVLKQRLSRLGPAVRRALDEARERREKQAAEIALREKTEWLAATLNSIADAVIATDPAGRIRLLNPVAEALTGWRADEAAGQELGRVFRTLDEASRAPAEDPVERVLRTGQASSPASHTLLVARDGTERPIEESAAPIRDEGAASGVILVFRDVSKTKRDEATIRKNEERLRLSTEAADLGVFEWDIARDRITLENQRVCEILGLGRDDGPFTAAEFFAEVVHGEEVDASSRALMQARQVGGRFHFTCRAGGGARWIEFTGRCEMGPDGQALRMPGIVADITERKRVEEERAALLAQERRRSRQLQELGDLSTRLNGALDVNSVVGVVAGEARKLIDVHHALITLAAAGGTRAFNLVSASEKYAGDDGEPAGFIDAEGLATLVCRTNRSQRLTEDEVRALPEWLDQEKAGMPRLPLKGWLAAPLIDRAGRNIGLLQLSDKLEGNFTDDDEAILVQLVQIASVAIENARLYDELRDKDRRKDEFLAMLAHELRNPLAAVGNAVTLLKVSKEPANAEFSREVIERQVKQLSRLIDDLLDASRITTGKIRLRKELIDASTILDRAIESARPLIDDRKHELIASIDRGRLPLDVDPTRVEQIAVNLLTNAAKYTEGGGKIWLSARAEGGQVVIRVRDNGIGIPPEKLPEMFLLFAQGERSIARSEGGLGIGLTVVRDLAEMHGGVVVATSDGPGRGSEFVVRLPLADRAAAAAPESPASGTPSGRRSRRILVVDDNRDTARGMGRLFKILGNDVQVAHDGPSAVEAALAFRPHYVLLDIGLPGMDGYQVASRLREERGMDSLVIIAVSGYGQEDDRRRSRLAGFNHHLVKPVDFDTLVSLIG